MISSTSDTPGLSCVIEEEDLDRRFKKETDHKYYLKCRAALIFTRQKLQADNLSVYERSVLEAAIVYIKEAINDLETTRTSS